MNTEPHRFNVLTEIATYALKVRELLPTIPRFEFMTKSVNRLSYTNQQKEAKRKSRGQIELYFHWLLNEFVNIFLNKYKLKLAKVQLVDCSDAVECLKIDIMESPRITGIEVLEEKMLFKIRQYARKEITNLSDAAWQSFINAGTNFGSLRFVKECRKCLDSEIKYQANSMGLYCDPKTKLLYYLDLFKDKIVINNNTINIRLAGDGTNIASNFTVFNFWFGFLDRFSESADLHTERNGTIDPNTALGNFILGKFYIRKECYDDLKIALKEFAEKISDLKEIEFEGIIYKIEFFLGGDLKFLAIVMGINAACSNYPCPWCTLHKNQFSTSISDHSINRTLSVNEYGQLHEPIFKFISVQNTIPDPLHMSLRITDKLENNLHDDLGQMDDTFSENISQNTHFESYVNYLEEILNIKKPFYTNKITKKLTLRDLNGVEKKKLFDLPLLFPGLENSEIKSSIWKDFYDLMYKLKDDRINLFEIKYQTKSWLELFTSLPSVDSTNDVTPYMHTFASHLHEQIDNLKRRGLYFNSFSMQGLEFLNCLDTRCFHRSTNKKGDIIRQLIYKRSRVEILSFHKDLVSLFAERRVNLRASEREAYNQRMIEELDSNDQIDDQPDVNNAEAEIGAF